MSDKEQEERQGRNLQNPVSFRLDEATDRRLDAMVDRGRARDRTDALRRAVEYYCKVQRISVEGEE